jgi:anti-sigma factor RsiW
MSPEAEAMPHIAEHELIEYLDRELSSGRRADVARHLAACPACAAGLDRLQANSEKLTAALQRFDATPDYDIEALLALRKSRGRRHLTLRALAKAAVLVFVVGGAGAAAIPGSPVQAWVQDGWSDARSWLGLAVDDQAPAPSVVEQPGRSRTAGIAVPLVDERVRIDLRDAASDALIRVSLTQGTEAAVTAEDASYRTGSGWIEIRGAGPGVIRIEIPERAVSAIVSVDGAPKVLKEGDGLRLVSAPGATSTSELQFRVER